ncbi:hypothetical protein [Halostagnicola kamekurae]|uniref:Small CPxCG-related zinc finger protein n=1 Tax=Halostagnicola kamekurae TaxID=619731 RepID=A0A1I6RSS8_9EURY|nr:hypothetical protein [Halostagnicola kamekurae]SFS67696.1 hypothetical protein SAMN04488556_2067 [Halostagnicola kamekurae]
MSGDDTGSPSQDDRDSTPVDDADGPSLPDCPRCGESVALVTSGGPMATQAQPCGCRVRNPSLEDSSDD